MKKKKYISEIPHLMKEWDWDANVGLDPNKITYGSHKKACGNVRNVDINGTKLLWREPEK